MNSRRRLIKTLNHEIPDKIPCTAAIGSYFLNSRKDKYGKMSSSTFLKTLGYDVFNWVGFNSKSKNVLVQTYIGDKLYKSVEGGNWINEFYDYIFNVNFYRRFGKKEIKRKFVTSLGELTVKFLYSRESNTAFIAELPIKKLQDYKIFSYMINDIEYIKLDEDFKQKEDDIGKYGINVACLHSTPAYELIQCFMGLERFLYMLYDYKRETIDLMDKMFIKYRECYKIYSKTAIRAFLVPEDASTTLYSPKIFNKYFKPVLEEYCRIIKDSGKIAIIHACGHLRGLANYLKETGADCIESVSPPPTGDINIDELKKILPGYCIMGGIPANYFLLELNDFKKYVKELILKSKKGGNFILSSGDAVPRDAKIDNLRVIPELVWLYGQY